MASAVIRKTLNPTVRTVLRIPIPTIRRLSGVAVAAADPEPSSSFTFSSSDPKSDSATDNNDHIFLKNSPKETSTTSSSSVTMPMSFMTGSKVGKQFYRKVTTREAEDGNGWTVMLDYRTLESPSKRPLKYPTLALAKAIAVEWEYQLADGIRPFTMPLMKLACNALERVPLTRPKIVENLMKRFKQDLVCCRAPGDDPLASDLLGFSRSYCWLFKKQKRRLEDWTRKGERSRIMKRIIQSGIRNLNTVAESVPHLTKFSLQAPKTVKVEYDNGSAYILSAEYLRIYSPAVDSKIRTIGVEKVISGRRHVGIMSAEPVGNYGVRLVFDDLHRTGIFTWDYFYHLGSCKFTLMKNYIRMLKRHGLTRDPPRKK